MGKPRIIRSGASLLVAILYKINNIGEKRLAFLQKRKEENHYSLTNPSVIGILNLGMCFFTVFCLRCCAVMDPISFAQEYMAIVLVK